MAPRKPNRWQRVTLRIAADLKRRRWKYALASGHDHLLRDAAQERLAQATATEAATAKRSANSHAMKDECLAIANELGDCKAEAAVAEIQARLGDRAPARSTIMSYLSVRDRAIPD